MFRETTGFPRQHTVGLIYGAKPNVRGSDRKTALTCSKIGDTAVTNTKRREHGKDGSMAGKKAKHVL